MEKMSGCSFWAPLKEGVEKREVLLWSAFLLLPTLKVLIGDHAFFHQWAGSFLQDPERLEWWEWQYHFFSTFLLFALIPLLLVRGPLNMSPSAIGFTIGDWRFGLKATLVAFILLPLPIYYLTRDPEHLAYYPRSSTALSSPAYFMLYGITYGLHYTGWETFFRGFVGMGMRPLLGSFGAIALQTSTTTLMHIGKPMGETVGAIIAGIYLGLLTYRTGSVFWAILFHWFLGVLNAYFCSLP